eukprot:scaffold236834_cov14-Tisochrysis_lutea.AAC.1
MGWGKWRWGSLLAWMGRKGSGIGASALECAAWWLAVRGGGLPKVWPGGRGRSWGATVADAACPEGVHAWTGGGPCSCWRGRGCKLWGWEAWACGGGSEVAWAGSPSSLNSCRRVWNPRNCCCCCCCSC